MTHVGIVAVSEPKFGGTFPYTLSMIEALLRIPGYRYTIFTTAQNHAYDSFGIPVVRLPAPVPALARSIGVSLGMSAWCGLFAQTDKLIAPIYTTYLLAARRPYVYTLHDLQERYFPENFTLAQRLWRLLTNTLLARRAARIVCESNHVKSDIVRFFGVQPARISVIAAPPVSAFRDVDLSAATLAEVRTRLSLPERYLLYPAQFCVHKNHLRLLEAFARVASRDAHIHLVLTGSKRFEYDKVMARAAQLGLAQRVRHVGQLEIDDLARVYRLAQLVVIPTLFESISIPIYEAWMMRVPVCASNVVALPEQLGDAGLLFDPLSVADIAAKIATVLEDEELRHTLIARGERRVTALTVDRYAQELRLMLEQVGERGESPVAGYDPGKA
jgi:glycosyltransferase involved in cell wall biosynthesis